MDRSTSPPSSEELESRLESVDSRLQQVTMRLEAVCELLVARGAVGEAELLEKLREIDLRDGIEDGRNVAPQVQVCGKCGRTRVGEHRFCAHCGSDALQTL